MRLKIFLILFFSAVLILTAYADDMPAVSYYQQHIEAVNRQMDEVEGLVLPRAVKEEPQPLKPLIVFRKVKKTTNAFYDRVNTFSLDFQTRYSYYKEPQNTRDVSGVWGGIDGKYVFRPPQGNIFNTPVLNFYAIESLYATGKGDLKENVQRVSDDSWTKLILKNIPGYMFDERILLGRDFIPLPTFRVTPYTGFGVRYRTDHSAGHYNVYDFVAPSPVVALGYDVSDLYYYIPAGLTFDLATRNDYQISLNFEFDFLIKGYERDDLAGLDQFTLPEDGFTSQNLRYNLYRGWGDRASLKFLKHLSLVDVYFEPYLRYWHIPASKVITGTVLNDPYTASSNKNNTIEVGSSLGVQF